MNKWGVAAIALSYLIVFGLIGSEDLKEELDQAKQYCDMVQAGAWPAYDKSINCDKVETMEDNRSDKVKVICGQYVEQGCFNCPLGKPCSTQAGDTKEVFDIRMNQAAEDLEKANG